VSVQTHRMGREARQTLIPANATRNTNTTHGTNATCATNTTRDTNTTHGKEQNR
jgi:hypothetical protein